MGIKFGSNGNGSSGVTPEQELTLKYLKYNPTTNKIDATRTVAVEPNSIDIGNHTISSGAENAFFTNRTSDIDWFPAWSGIKDQSIVGNQTNTGVIPPSFRHYNTDITEIELDGAVAGTGSVDYNADSVVGINNSVFGQEVVVMESIAADDWILYEVRIGGINDPVVYKQIITGRVLSAGDTLVWWFDHPVEGRAGTVINSTMRIAKGSQDGNYTFLKVRPIASDPTTRYLKIKFRLFTDEDVMSGTLFTTASQVIRYAATYAVDTETAAVTLDVDSSIGYKSFTIFDSNKSFSVTNPCIVDFGTLTYPAGLIKEGVNVGGQLVGKATLQTKNDSYLFYWDGTKWRYLDLNTENRGIV
jgi:hypothetical protein